MDSSATPGSLGEYLRQTAPQLAVALGVYFGLRAFGVPPYLALAATALAAIVHVALSVLRGRKADVVLVVVVVLYGTSAVVTLATHNPRYAQLLNLFPGTAIGLALLVSAVVGKPLTAFVAAQYRPLLARSALPGRGWSARDIQDYARMHRRTTFAVAVTGVVQTTVSVLVILSCSTDIAQLFCDVVGTGTTVLILVLAVRHIRRFVNARDAAAAEPKEAGFAAQDASR